MPLTREVIEFYQVDLPAITKIQEETDQLVMYYGANSSDIEAVSQINAKYYPTRKMGLADSNGLVTDLLSMWEAKPSEATDGNWPKECLVFGDDVVYTSSPAVLSVFENDKGKYVYCDQVASERDVRYIPGTIKAQQAVESEVFRFHVNPSKIEIAKNKHITKIRTRKGFEFQYWGQEITAVTISGTTGSLLRAASGRGAANNEDIYDSPAYVAFKKLEDMYNGDHRDESVSADTLLGMRYRDRVFIGHFDTFSFSEDAEKPYSFSYNIKFSVQDEVTSVATTELARRYATDQETLLALRMAEK